MWKIKQIFDGDFGCEELAPGERPKVSVTLSRLLVGYRRGIQLRMR